MSVILKFIRENHILALIEQAISKKKSRLCLNAFEMIEIPSLLYTCSDVEHLYLHRNKITIIPVEITQLINLTTLTLDYNNISALPPEIGNLKNLVNLNISYNPLNVLIPEIGELENLEAFWCNRIGLREIPKEIEKLEKLDTFGARGNELKTIPKEMTNLSKLRWLTLENNNIETLPDTMNNMMALVHCNLRNNRIREFPSSILKCQDLMFLQLNNNQIASLPVDFDTCYMSVLEMIDLRINPICEIAHPDHPLVRYAEELPTDNALVDMSPQASTSRNHGGQALIVNATALRLPAVPAARHVDPLVLDLDLDASSVESSEDWENSVNSSELDVQYQSDDDQADNESLEPTHDMTEQQLSDEDPPIQRRRLLDEATLEWLVSEYLRASPTVPVIEQLRNIVSNVTPHNFLDSDNLQWDGRATTVSTQCNEEVRQVMEWEVREYRSMSQEIRPYLPRLPMHKRKRVLVSALESILPTYLDTSDNLSNIYSILYCAACAAMFV